jgi:deoxyribodipyrimidine photo-lyase
MGVNKDRVKLIQSGRENTGPIIYWMSRDQRTADNWALLFAKQMADKNRVPLAVVFNLASSYLEAVGSHYDFMLEGLKQIESSLLKLNIPMFLISGKPEKQIPLFIEKVNAGILVTDFNPLKISRLWKKEAAQKINIPFYEVDAHNIVPCWLASPKQEYAAYTFRPKINRLLQSYLGDFPSLKKHKYDWPDRSARINWREARKSIRVSESIFGASRIKSGEDKAISAMYDFLENRLVRYNQLRNDPTKNGQSNLSIYLHFGQLSAQRLAYETPKFDRDLSSQEAFMEELVVRRELSDNFCYYNSNYDSFDGFPIWAQETLNLHRRDRRDYIYGIEEFEQSRTHDDLWNAAQLEMVYTGKMHGYMRMYWAKKILEWSKTPEDALEAAIYLNDKYEYDGRDPNGYAGIAWSVGGVHDRAWPERRVLGKIRYMSYDGCRRKFDIKKYINRVMQIGSDLKS